MATLGGFSTTSHAPARETAGSRLERHGVRANRGVAVRERRRGSARLDDDDDSDEGADEARRVRGSGGPGEDDNDGEMGRVDRDGARGDEFGAAGERRHGQGGDDSHQTSNGRRD